MSEVPAELQVDQPASPENQVDDQQQISRRGLLAMLGSVALGAVATAITWKLNKLLKTKLSPEQEKKALEVVEKLRAKYPLEKFGHMNLPWGFNGEGKLEMLRVGSNVSNGWDCFDASNDLAVELEQAGFVSGLVRGKDDLAIWGDHSRAFIEVDGSRFELDLTPPYHNGNAGDFDVGHRKIESNYISQMPWLKNPEKNSRKNPNILSQVPQPFEYFEKVVDGKKYGYMLLVVLDQRDNFGPISKDGGEIFLGGVIMEFSITKDGEEPAIDLSRVFSYGWEREDGQLVPLEGAIGPHLVVSRGETANFLVENQDVQRKVIDGFLRFDKKVRGVSEQF